MDGRRKYTGYRVHYSRYVMGGIEVGNGQGASRVRAFFSRERAEKAIKNVDRWGITSSYRVIKYKMNAE